jgi:hypothetical protein
MWYEHDMEGSQLTLIVSCSIVTDVLDTLGQSLDELLIEYTDSLGTIIVPIDSNDPIVLPTRLAVLEEFLSGRGGQFLPRVSASLHPFSFSFSCSFTKRNEMDAYDDLGDGSEFGGLFIFRPDNTVLWVGCILASYRSTKSEAPTSNKDLGL